MPQKKSRSRVGNITGHTLLKNLTRIGQVTAGRLANLGLKTVKDLLFYFPMRYDDYTEIVKIKDLTLEKNCTVQVTVEKINNFVTKYKRQKITTAYVSDGAGKLKIVWFNQPFLINQIQPQDKISLAGKAEIDGFSLVMKSPQWERTGNNLHTGRLVPVYSLTYGLTQRQIRFLVSQALKAVDQVSDWLDQQLKSQINLPLINLSWALQEIHFPKNNQLLSQARLRLKFEELFWLQIKKAATRYKRAKQKASKLYFKEKEIKKFVKSLPFKLTTAQKKCAWQILKDLAKKTPMNRMLQGDVGSGKTVVAVIAMLNCVLNKHQAVLMVPTEILAKQHYDKIKNYLVDLDLKLGLWTRSSKKLELISGQIKTLKKTRSKNSNTLSVIHQADLIVGTHALIQDRIKFRKLALAVIDEQHRFGVKQRKALRDQSGDKITYPHFLSMSATPIPRSLALTMYGDLDISVIDQMPKGRKKVITKVVLPKERKETYKFIHHQIINGHQVFVVCPLIEESDKLGVRAVNTEFKKLDKKIFPNLKIGLLHGKLKDKEKEAVQRKFAQRKLDILIATSVIEVGIDIPNANVMMIEGAERFGLAQLHQFRGRVGRGANQSYCFLFTDSKSRAVYQRLDFLTRTSDGFKVAEFDLKTRGSGEIYSTQQHGFPEFKLASFADTKLIESAQKLARFIIKKDSDLRSYPLIKEKFKQAGGLAHLE